MNFLTEAFKALDVLNEDTFNADEKGLDELRDFIGNDEGEDIISIIDDEAETEDELEDSYVGKVILCCNVCKSNVYKDKKDVIVDEDTEFANVGDECPYCHTVDGFKIVGEVAPFEKVEVETDDDGEDIEVKVDGEEVEVKEDESLTEDVDDTGHTNMIDSVKGKIKSLNRICLDLVDSALNGDSLIYEASKSNAPHVLDEIIENADYIRSVVSERDESLTEAKKSEDDIDAIRDNRAERAKRRFTRVRDDADSRRDYMKKHDMKECGDMKNEACSDRRKKKVDEDFSEVEVTTAGEEKQKIKVSSEEVEGEETIVPVTNEVEDEIMMDSEEETFEEPVEETEEETTEEEGIVEESLNSLCSKYLKENYSNVKSFRLVEAKTNGKKLKLEGIIKFASGAEKKTSFLFESAKPNARGKVRMLGENLEICRGKKAFVLSGVIRGNKLLGESLSYNYMTKNEEGKSQRVSGTVSNKRG